MRHRKRREGVVLLIVMWVMMMASAMATVAMNMSRSSLKVAGDYRIATQGNYLVEGALAQGIALTETASEWSSQTDPVGSLRMFQRFGHADTGPLHETRHIGGADLTTGLVAPEVPFYQDPGPANGHVGTLGTSAVYSPTSSAGAGRYDFEVDLMDCAPFSAAAPGKDLSGSGTGSMIEDKASMELCAFEARARLEAAATPTRTWTVPGQGGTYTQAILGTERTAVGTVIIKTK